MGVASGYLHEVHVVYIINLLHMHDTVYIIWALVVSAWEVIKCKSVYKMRRMKIRK